MSTDQQKQIRDRERQGKDKWATRVMHKSELKQLVRKLNYPQIYGQLPDPIIAQLKKMGIEKKNKGSVDDVSNK